jgi:hypothetical protein
MSTNLPVALLSEIAGSIADRYGVSKTALIRHKSQHLSAHLAKAKGAAEVLSADLLFSRLEELREETLGVLRRAKGSKDPRTLLAAIGRLEGQLRLLAELAGQLRSRERADELIGWPAEVSQLNDRQVAKLKTWMEQIAFRNDPAGLEEWRRGEPHGFIEVNQ